MLAENLKAEDVNIHNYVYNFKGTEKGKCALKGNVSKFGAVVIVPGDKKTKQGL